MLVISRPNVKSHYEKVTLFSSLIIAQDLKEYSENDKVDIANDFSSSLNYNQHNYLLPFVSS
jgi:hypothetical protein